jgi:hypothetical protein
LNVQALLEHPAIQAGVVPLVVALIVAAVLCRTRYAWLAIIAGYAAMIALTTGFSFTPLTASRKLVLVVVLSAAAGMAADLVPRVQRALAVAFAVAAGIIAPWVFQSVLLQREGTQGYATGAAIGVFVAALVYLVVRQRGDGLRAGAAGVGLGLATGIAGVLSASIGFLLSGVAIAAAAGAVLLAQVLLSRSLAPGFTGTLPIGVATALFAAGTLLLAELRWYVLPLLLLVPVAVALPAAERAPRIVRAAILVAYALVAAAIPILAAWYAARGSLN